MADDFAMLIDGSWAASGVGRRHGGDEPVHR